MNLPLELGIGRPTFMQSYVPVKKQSKLLPRESPAKTAEAENKLCSFHPIIIRKIIFSYFY